MSNFLSNAQIEQLVLQNDGKTLMFRSGIDYRFSGVKGSDRNQPITLEELLKKADHYFIELSDRECNNEQIVFQGYSVLDMD